MDKGAKSLKYKLNHSAGGIMSASEAFMDYRLTERVKAAG